MGALAAASRHALGATGAARPMGLSQQACASNGAFSTAVRVDCGLSYTTGQATIALRDSGL